MFHVQLNSAFLYGLMKILLLAPKRCKSLHIVQNEMDAGEALIDHVCESP